MKKTILTLLALAVMPTSARADGMMYTQVGGEVSVKATAQRAVLWLRNGTWEVHIQPVFSREQGEAAWVVPFPVQPTVDESDADLFDQLELITSPAFIRYCTDDSGGGCGTMAADGQGGTSRGGEGHVRVWEKGQVGQLDYVIVTSSDGTALASWLDGHGYEIPSDAQPVFTELETEDVFFFAARISDDVDPAKPLAPVRFVLPDLVSPTYPLRMTGLGMEQGDALELTLWIVFPDGQGWIPDSHPYDMLSGYYQDRDQYDAAMNSFFASHSADTLLLRARVTLGIWPTDLPDFEFCENGWRCASMADLGIAQPAWTSELMEMNQLGTNVFRYEARLSGQALKSKDFLLRTTDPYDLPYVNNVYGYDVGQCSRGIDCSVAGQAGGFFLILGLAGLLLWLYGSGRRSRRSRSR